MARFVDVVAHRFNCGRGNKDENVERERELVDDNDYLMFLTCDMRQSVLDMRQSINPTGSVLST